jgi:hypothetical protein
LELFFIIFKMGGKQEMKEANFDNPMNTAEAVERFQCDVCKSGGMCEWDCVESATCSLRCAACNERNWFMGDLPRESGRFKCVRCGGENAMDWRPFRIRLVG